MSEPGASSGVLRVLSLALRGGAGLLVLAAAIGITATLVATRPQPLQSARVERVITVRAVRVEPVHVARVWEGYGTARAMRSADISAQVAARVVERPEGLEAGVPVTAGEVLLRLDPLDFEQRIAASTQVIASWQAQVAGLDVDERRLADQYELSEEELRLEERELERVRSAAELRGANDVEVERRQALVSRKRRELSALKQQIESIAPERTRMRAMIGGEEAALRIARENLERATIRAPIAGFLQEIHADRGEMLAVGTPVARIVDLTRIEIPLRLPVSASASVAIGDAVELTADSPGASPDELRWSGRVVRIAPESDPGSRTITVFAEVLQHAGPDAGGGRAGLLLPGQFVLGRVTTTAVEQRAVVPRGAINAERVMIAEPAGDGQRARAVSVRVLFHVRGFFPGVDPAETEWAVLEDGLPPGSAVITTNLDEVRAGVRIRVDAGNAVATDGPPAPAAGPGGGGS